MEIESKMHLIASKLDQNTIQKFDKQIKARLKLDGKWINR